MNFDCTGSTCGSQVKEMLLTVMGCFWNVNDVFSITFRDFGNEKLRKNDFVGFFH